MKGKRGLSEIVSTVLIILITITAISILSFTIINFTRDNLDKGDDCLDVLGMLTIIEKDTCYGDIVGEENTTIRIKRGNINTDEIYFILDDGINSKSYNVKNGSIYPEINLGQVLSIPGKAGGEKVYYIDGIKANRAIVGFVFKNNRCQASDEAEIVKC